MGGICKVWNKRVNGERLFGDWELALLVGLVFTTVAFFTVWICGAKTEVIATFFAAMCISLSFVMLDLFIILGCAIRFKK